MVMSPQVAANRIIRELCQSEAELDRALASSAALLSSLAQARVDTGASFADSQVAIMRLVNGLSSLSRARTDLVRTHGELRRIGEERGDLVFPHESLGSLEAVEAAFEAQAA